MPEEIKKEEILTEDESIVEESGEQQEEVKAIPFSSIIVGMVERGMKNVIEDEDEYKRFVESYESMTMPVLEQMGFDDVLSRKMFAGRELTDKEVLTFGFVWLGISTAIHIVPVLIKKKRKKEGEEHGTQNRNEIEDSNKT